MDSPMEMHGEWKQAIGRFIVNFAECELWVSSWARRLFPEGVAEEIVRIPLERRARLVREMLRTRQLPIEPSRVEHSFERLQELTKFRNLIAHNPPVLAILDGTHDREVVTQVQLVSARDRKTQASLKDILDRGDEAARLAQDMLNMQIAMQWHALDQGAQDFGPEPGDGDPDDFGRNE